MRRIVSGPLAALMVLWTIPAPAWASLASRAVGPEGEDDEDLIIIDEGEMEGEEPAAEGEEEAAPPVDDDVSDDLFGTDTRADIPGEAPPPGTTTGKADKDSEAQQIKAEMGLISVVQRQRMLKKGRFELQPQFGITVNDPYVRHYTLGVDFNYWLTNRMALGLTGTGFIGQQTPRYRNIRFQEGLLLTANRVLWQASVNYTYNPFYGKIAIFNRALLHWEGSVTIGGGPMQTQVIPRYPTLHEPFNTFTGGGHVGLMGRFYTRRIDWLSFNAGVRTWIFADKLEPGQRGPDVDPGNPLADLADLDDPDNAKDAADFEVAFNVVFFLGVSFYFPTSFEYTTPR
jgi:outer membrane beta-barrel protein